MEMHSLIQSWIFHENRCKVGYCSRNSLSDICQTHTDSRTSVALHINTSRPRQNGHHFADSFSKFISWMKIVNFAYNFTFHWIWFLIFHLTICKMSHSQIMAWILNGSMPLSEPMTVSLLTHICVTQFQWISCLIPEKNGTQHDSWCSNSINHQPYSSLRCCSSHDVIKWKHFPRYWPFVWWIHRSPVNSPLKGQWRRAFLWYVPE